MNRYLIGIFSALVGLMLISGCGNPKDEWKSLMTEYETFANRYSSIAEGSALDDQVSQDQLKGIFSNMQALSVKLQEKKLELTPENIQLFEQRMDDANSVLLKAKANQVKKAMEAIMGGGMGALMNNAIIGTLTNQTNK
jgi:uncharacterized protein YhaN